MKFDLSTRAQRRRPSPIRELVQYMGIEGMISFGGGYPNPETFAFEQVTVRLTGDDEPLVIEGEDMVAATQYGATPGSPALHAALRKWHASRGHPVPDEGGLLVLNGSQEGLYLLADALLDDGDVVAVGEPTYPGALACFRSFTDRFLSVPSDSAGLRVDALERLLDDLRERGGTPPRFIYVIPNGDNPAGTTMPLERRERLAALARERDLLLVEDDPYELVRMEPGEALPSLQQLAPENVLRLDSFSKILCPGLRLGYATGPQALIRAMVLHKQASNLHTSTFAQGVLAAYLRREGADGLRARIRRNMELYRANRDAMLAAAHEHLPDDARFGTPDSGMFLWVTLPEGFDVERMVREDCRALKILLVPGAAFSTQGGLKSCLRVSYSLVTPEAIDEGMRRLGEMIARERARQ